MNTKKIIGILLIIGGLALGYTGLNKIENSGASVKVLDIELDVSDKGSKQQGYIYLGLGILLVAGGVYTVNKK